LSRRRSRAPPVPPLYLTSTVSTGRSRTWIPLLVIVFLVLEPGVLIVAYFVISTVATLRIVWQFSRALYESER
jgi:hypothetical protein